MELLRRRKSSPVMPRAMLLAVPWLLAGCLGTYPEEREPALQGDFRDGNAEHRPGQPCITCHNDDPLFPIAPAFELAGTVYDEIDAGPNEGLSGVEVLVTDDAGHELIAISNRVGNFYVEVNSGLAEPVQGRQGHVEIPWRLQFPLRARIRKGEVETPMETLIWRSRSCASCHGAAEGADSVGRVFLDEEAMP